MRPRARLVAAVSVVTLTVAGCTDPADPPASSPATPDAEESASSSVAAVPEPTPGTCWRVPAESVVDQDYWYDDSAQVPCTERHTTETVNVFHLDAPTVAEGEKWAERCWDYVHAYVGIGAHSWIPWSPVVFLPSRDEAASGASWLRCDADFPATTQLSEVRTTTGSASGLAESPPVDFWACTDRPPSGADQPFVPCDRPHQYEETGTLAIVSGRDGYPADAALATEAREQCRESVPAGYEDVAVGASWDPRAGWTEGRAIAGWCFVFRKDQRPLPAR